MRASCIGVQNMQISLVSPLYTKDAKSAPSCLQSDENYSVEVRASWVGVFSEYTGLSYKCFLIYTEDAKGARYDHAD